jgi:putative phosphoserine phosphatase/1-acylglycerol-3-phosphate O-acyltransferase
VPIVIRNSGELMWRNARTTQPGTVQVVVHEPISTQGWTRADLDRRFGEVEQLYVSTLENWPTSGPSLTKAAR